MLTVAPLPWCRWQLRRSCFSRSCGSSSDAQPAAEQVDGEHGEAEQETGIDDQPLVAEQLVVAGAADVEAPGDSGVLDAEPEEAQRRLGQDDAGELEHGQRGERREQGSAGCGVNDDPAAAWQPTISAASTNGRSRTESTTPRVMRA